MLCVVVLCEHLLAWGSTPCLLVREAPSAVSLLPAVVSYVSSISTFEARYCGWWISSSSAVLSCVALSSTNITAGGPFLTSVES